MAFAPDARGLARTRSPVSSTSGAAAAFTGTGDAPGVDAVAATGVARDARRTAVNAAAARDRGWGMTVSFARTDMR